MSKISLCLAILFVGRISAIEYYMLPADEIPKSKQVSQQCATDNGINEPGILSRFEAYHLNLDDETERKYAYCYLTTMGYADKDGRLNKEKLKYLSQNYKSDDLMKALDICNSKATAAEPVDALVQVLLCFTDNSPLEFSTYDIK